MKINSLFATLAIVGCTPISNVLQHKEMEQNIEFENIYHYKNVIIDEPFKVINTQSEMDEIYRKVHQHVEGNRLSPIPTVFNDTYVVIKPNLKGLNDVTVDSVFYKNKTITILVRPFANPEYKQDDKKNPNIILRFNQVLNIEKVKINY